ncbi:MAG: hypothetical protein U0326_18485 [Polyangiales bacterium]
MLNTDAANCGACGRACNRTNGLPICAGGTCVSITCNSGFGNCDSDVANGCESNFATNASHCNGCGNRCNFPNRRPLRQRLLHPRHLRRGLWRL